MTSALPRVVLDANILFSRVLHELMGRAGNWSGSVGLYDVFWSEELLAETAAALIERYGVPPTSADRALRFVRDGFPANNIDISMVGDSVDLSRYTRDPKDQHVCALAIAAKADILVTNDRGFCNAELLEDHGIHVRHPDGFLVDLLTEHGGFFVELVAQWASSRHATTPRDLLDKIAAAGCGTFASLAAALLADSD